MGTLTYRSIPMGLFRRNDRHFRRCAVLFLLLLMAGSVLADDAKISPDLRPLLSNPNTSVNVIVQYNSAPQQTCGSGGGLLGGLVGGVVCTLVGVVKIAVNVVFTLVNAVAGTMLA